MSNPDKVIFSSRYKYFLNKAVEEGTVTLTAQSIPAGEARKYDLSIPIENAQNYSQIKVNFSHDANDWYIFPVLDIRLDANFNISVTGAYDSNSLDLSFFVVNQTGSTHTSTASTVTVRVYLFETPE